MIDLIAPNATHTHAFTPFHLLIVQIQQLLVHWFPHLLLYTGVENTGKKQPVHFRNRWTADKGSGEAMFQQDLDR